MNWCACGNPIPDGFDVCELCEAFGDDDPLPSDEHGYTPEDARIDAMSDETYWFGEMSCWYGEDEQKEAA